jgi:hypothetical protein
MWENPRQSSSSDIQIISRKSKIKWGVLAITMVGKMDVVMQTFSIYIYSICTIEKCNIDIICITFFYWTDV